MAKKRWDGGNIDGLKVFIRLGGNIGRLKVVIHLGGLKVVIRLGRNIGGLKVFLSGWVFPGYGQVMVSNFTLIANIQLSGIV